MFWSKVLYCEILARVWEAKHTSNVFQIWKANSQFIHLERTSSDIDERSQETKSWSCFSQSRKSWFTIPRDRSSELWNFKANHELQWQNVEDCDHELLRKSVSPNKKIMIFNLTEIEWLNEIWTKWLEEEDFKVCWDFSIDEVERSDTYYNWENKKRNNPVKKVLIKSYVLFFIEQTSICIPQLFLPTNKLAHMCTTLTTC